MPKRIESFEIQIRDFVESISKDTIDICTMQDSTWKSEKDYSQLQSTVDTHGALIGGLREDSIESLEVDDQHEGDGVKMPNAGTTSAEPTQDGVNQASNGNPEMLINNSLAVDDSDE